MILYTLYRLGYFMAMTLPVRISYAVAYLLASACYMFSGDERRAIQSNLKVVLGDSYDSKKANILTRRVFVNFAKYLVDFFRFSCIDRDYIKRCVKVDGIEHLDEAILKGKGVIALSAHLGNWELGALCVAALRPPLAAIVLTHQNKKINEFFKRQRTIANFKPIEISFALRECFAILKKNGLLALLGDRDFTKRGVHTNFFGRSILIPKGPAVFSAHLGSAIVPVFMIRNSDDTFHLVFERPIYPIAHDNEEESIKRLIETYTAVIESYVRRYPDQWFMFRDVWNNHAKEDLRSDSVL